jgi:hypothetical protein
MFSPGDQYDQSMVASALEQAGYATYLPQRDGLDLGHYFAALNDPAIDATTRNDAVVLIRKACFALDASEVLGGARALVFNMNGRVPDEGSVVEVAMAYMAGIPLVIYKNTPITAEGQYDNPMVQGLSGTWQYARDYTDIVPAVQAALAASTNQGFVFTPPPALLSTIEQGRKVNDLAEQVSHIGTGGLTGPALLAAVTQLNAALESLGFTAIGG